LDRTGPPSTMSDTSSRGADVFGGRVATVGGIVFMVGSEDRSIDVGSTVVGSWVNCVVLVAVGDCEIDTTGNAVATVGSKVVGSVVMGAVVGVTVFSLTV
jgi:hypothetical protein